MNRLCVFLFVITCAEAGIIAGKAFLCRDPDTGKLHSVNTTWPSSTFCGNYHCRLRKKNITQVEYMRQINVPNVDIGNDVTKKEQYFDRNSLFRKVNPTKNTEDIIRINNMMAADVVNTTQEQVMPDTKPKTTDSDRYLTEGEIKTISTILHTVKKSDLDAIVEIYNLAQDIYKEIDNTSPDNLIHETMHDIKQVKGANKPTPINAQEKKRISYWYEPMVTGKRMFDIIKPDMDSSNSNVVKMTTPKPIPPATTTPSYVPIHNTVNTNTYGSLSKKGFGKLMYYNPLSTFQRESSYVHLPLGQNRPYIRPVTTPGLRQQTTKYQKPVTTSKGYLPYPFTFMPRHYNRTYAHSRYFTKTHVKHTEPSLKDRKQILIRNAVLINPDLENFQEPVVSPVKKEAKSLMQMMKVGNKGEKRDQRSQYDWQTDSISKQILEEIRAHIEKTRWLKPFSLRKKVKLERVGKVIKMDELNKRSKREAETTEVALEPELYEVHVERTTCVSDDTQPGFFRYGNMSQPFPACCPQRIR